MKHAHPLFNVLSRSFFLLLFLVLGLCFQAEAASETIKTYDKGWIVSETWVDGDNNRILNDQGFCYYVRKLDGAFRPLAISYFDTKDMPVNHAEGYAIVRMKYSGYGWLLEKSYWGTDGKAIEPPGIGYARMVNTYQGRKLSTVEYFGANGEYIVPEGQYAKRADSYNSRLLLIKREYFDTRGEYMLGPEGYAKMECEQPLR